MNAAEDTSYRREPKPTRTRAPEPILASAGYVAARRQPEKRLMVAILESAVSDLQHYATTSNGRGRRFFTEAKAWFASTASDGPGDFEYICEVLEFDPSAIRTRLRRWCAVRRGPDSVEPPAAPANGRPAGEWWMRGFACMTSAGQCETLPEKGPVQ
jgi:hypothetical protein